MGNRTCKVGGCENPSHARGMCPMHYQRWRKHGDPGVGAQPVRGTCSVEGCEKPAHARGWCGAHYYLWSQWGDPLADHRPKVQACSVEGCENLVSGRGWCRMHYARWKRSGDPLREPSLAYRHDWTPERREADFWSKVDKSGGPDACWPWTGHIAPSGYGVHSQARAHRVAFECISGPIPAEITIDHLCHQPEECEGGDDCPHRRCCNPAHLGLASAVSNAMRGNSPAAKNARKTHCPQGHPYDEVNTYIRQGHRYCRECGRERNRKYQQRRRSQAA